MDPLEFKTNEELIQFFRLKKTEISCMEQPQMFLRQLRDHGLIPEDKYKKVMKTKTKQKRMDGVYEILEWLETTRPENISLFWKCIFEAHILQQYPILRDMREILLGKSSTSSGKLPEKKETMEANEGKGVKRRKTEDGNKAEKLKEKESSKEEKKLVSPFKQSKTEEKSPKQETILSVVCGNKRGSLYKEKLAKGEKCILAETRWFYPFEFEEFAGRKSSRNWKTSIRYQNTSLLKLIQKGHLTCGKFKPSSQNKKILRLELKSQAKVSTSESQSKKQLMEARESSAGGAAASYRGDGVNNPSQFEGNRLAVTCGSARGILHKDRFATGLLGKCIRMEDKWVTPMDFLKEDPKSGDSDWMSRIRCLGMPLRDLLKKKVLCFHQLQCACRLCTSKDTALEQNNDDECFICDVPGRLLCCDQCPRAFHFECHIPAVNRGAMDCRDKWICTCCVLKNTLGWRLPCKMTLQDALENLISARLLDCQYLLLRLYKEDKEKVFKSDSQHLQASPKVQERMWLDKIAEKLQSKSYSTVGQFYSDVHLTFRNQGNFAKLGIKLTSLFEEEFRKVFHIHP